MKAGSSVPNDWPAVAAQPSFPLSVLVRSDFGCFVPAVLGMGLCGSDQTWIPGECHD